MIYDLPSLMASWLCGSLLEVFFVAYILFFCRTDTE